jgi:peptidyl-tRNA hydrolase
MDWNKPQTPNEDNPLVMYYIVRQSLNMGPGKMVAQGAHATQLILEYDKSLRRLKKDITEEQKNKTIRMDMWKDRALNGGFRKIVLTADDKEWETLKSDYNPIIVTDAGLTEVPAGSETVMVIFPILKSERCSTLKRMRCL